MDVEQRTQRSIVTIEQIVNVVVGGQVAHQGRLTQIIIEAIEVELTPVALHTTYGSMVLFYKQIELSDDGAVIGQHRWFDANRTNAKLLARDDNVKTMTCAMCSAGDMLYKTLLV